MQAMPLEQIANVRMGYPFRSRLEPVPDGDVAVIQMTDMDESIGGSVDRLIKILMPDMSARHFVQNGDLLFRSRGTTTTASLVSGVTSNTVLAAPMMLIRVKSGAGVIPSYLQWYINHPHTQKTLSARAEGTSVRMISVATLSEMEIPVPALARQEQVVAIASLAAKEQALMSRLSALRKNLVDSQLLKSVEEVAP